MAAKTAVLPGLLTALLTTGACGSSSSAKAGAQSRVVAVVEAENFWGDVVGQLGGRHVHVTSIIADPSADPHLYESNASDSAAVAEARLVIENGVGYDDFVGKLVSSTSNDSRQILVVAQVLGIKGDEANPHLWYDLPRVHEVAAAIEAKLARADPTDRKAFEANRRKFDQSMQPLLALITEIKSKFPHAPVAYTERVPGYLLAAAGLDIKTPAGFARAIEDGNEPSPGDTQQMDALMTNRRVRVLLYNAQASSPATDHVRALARRAGIPIVRVTETRPAEESTYQAWQLDQLRELIRALEH